MGGDERGAPVSPVLAAGTVYLPKPPAPRGTGFPHTRPLGPFSCAHVFPDCAMLTVVFARSQAAPGAGRPVAGTYITGLGQATSMPQPWPSLMLQTLRLKETMGPNRPLPAEEPPPERGGGERGQWHHRRRHPECRVLGGCSSPNFRGVLQLHPGVPRPCVAGTPLGGVRSSDNTNGEGGGSSGPRGSRLELRSCCDEWAYFHRRSFRPGLGSATWRDPQVPPAPHRGLPTPASPSGAHG